MASTFSAGGLASGLDSNSIIDQLVKLESAPKTMLQKKQTALKTQVSAIGDIASKLNALKTASDALGTSGALNLKTQSSNTAFDAVPSGTATAGRYSVEVVSLADAAKARSTAFADQYAPVAGGKLDLTVMGKPYQVTMTDGMPLVEVADAINKSGAPVSAVVLSDGTKSYLSLTNRETGYPITGTAADGLSITETTTGSTGAPLGLAITTPASNAEVKIDGLPITRTQNVLTDALPGVTLTLKAKGAAEGLVLSNDVDKTAENLGTFVTAYNDVLKLVQKQLQVSPGTDRSNTLAGDGAVRSLQAQLKSVLSAVLGNNGDVRALSDVGIKSNRDGSIELDKTVLQSAIGRNPASVNGLFSAASNGVSAILSTLVKGYADGLTGMLTQRQNSLNKRVSDLDNDITRMQTRIDKFRDHLVAQYTAMEKVVSGLKNIGNYLTSQEAAANRSANS